MRPAGAPPRWLRGVAPVLRMPAHFDRPGMRWMLRLCSPAAILVITHRGRRSGRRYRTTMELVSGSPAGDMNILPFAGRRSDWLRNIAAGPPVQGGCRGWRGALDWRIAESAEATLALDEYRACHRMYTRGVLAVVAHVNHFARGLPSAEIATKMPVVGFRFRSDR